MFSIKVEPKATATIGTVRPSRHGQNTNFALKWKVLGVIEDLVRRWEQDRAPVHQRYPVLTSHSLTLR